MEASGMHSRIICFLERRLSQQVPQDPAVAKLSESSHACMKFMNRRRTKFYGKHKIGCLCLPFSCHGRGGGQRLIGRGDDLCQQLVSWSLAANAHEARHAVAPASAMAALAGCRQELQAPAHRATSTCSCDRRSVVRDVTSPSLPPLLLVPPASVREGTTGPMPKAQRPW